MPTEWGLYQGMTSVMPPKRNKMKRASAPEGIVASQRTAEGESTQETLLALGWSALPASYRIPEKTPTLEEARAWCKRLAETHYENFHVATWFLPERLRPHFHAIYAYCRVSDDLGDEVGDTQQSLALLDLWGRELDACYEGRARHPVFVALAETIRACNIPKEPFADLLIAFRQDQIVTRYANMRGRARLLPLLRQPRRPPRPLHLWLFRRRALPPFRCDLFRPATRQFLAGRPRRFRQRPRLPPAGRHAALRRDRRNHPAGNCHPRVPRSPANTKSTMRAASSCRACRSSTWSIAISPSISISSAAAASKFSTPSSIGIMTCSAPARPSPSEPSSSLPCAP